MHTFIKMSCAFFSICAKRKQYFFRWLLYADYSRAFFDCIGWKRISYSRFCDILEKVFSVQDSQFSQIFFRYMRTSAKYFRTFSFFEKCTWVLDGNTITCVFVCALFMWYVCVPVCALCMCLVLDTSQSRLCAMYIYTFFVWFTILLA